MRRWGKQLGTSAKFSPRQKQVQNFPQLVIKLGLGLGLDQVHKFPHMGKFMHLIQQLLWGRRVLHICKHNRQSGCGNSKAVVGHANVIREMESDQKVCCGSVGSCEM